MADKSVFDGILRGLGDAVGDIRQKVVEEAWFGRSVTQHEGPQAEHETGPQVHVSITGWPQAREAQLETGEHERDSPADIDMDR